MNAPMTIAVVTRDAVLAAQIRRGARPGWEVSVTEDMASAEAESAAAVVMDLSLDGAPEAIRAWKQRNAATFVAASIALPKKELWEEAERAGADLVANRGAFMARFVPRFTEWLDAPGGRRVRLFSMADVAGRLGVVHRMTDEQAGPIAVYQVKGGIFAAQDVCPHAGRLLSEGETDEAIVTCPGHGSQYDVRTGARMRGPGDTDIATYRITIEQQEVFLVFDA